jgi:hypothetical protein
MWCAELSPQDRACFADGLGSGGIGCRPFEFNAEQNDILMSRKFFISRKVAVVLGILALMARTAFARHDGEGYLPVTGPSPMRIQVALRAQYTFPTHKIAKADEANAPTGIVTNEVPTLPVTATETSTNSEPTTLPVMTIGDTAPQIPVASATAAAEMLLVTPQMLAEFFKPGPGGTNGTSVFVPVQFNFAPPMQKSPASSQAIYKNQ